MISNSIAARNIFVLIYFFVSIYVCEGQNPPPASPQTKPVLLMNGIAHLGDGTVIQNSAIAFEDGKITIIADATTVRLDMKLFDVINISGKHVYPGFIAANTIIGLSEFELVRSTNDFDEVGSLNPNIRSIIAYNTDSKVTPTVRSNGVLLAQITPTGGLISGTSSVVELDAWNWEDAAFRTDDGIHLNWPSMMIDRVQKEKEKDEAKDRIEKSLLNLHDLFADAKAYSTLANPSEHNLKFESMRGLFNGSEKLYIHCEYTKEIISAVGFCKEFGVKMVLVGGADSWRITDLLRDNHIPVILGRTHSLPQREDEDADLPYKLPYLLKKAGVEFCLSVPGFWQVRNLPFNAGTAVGYGLTKEEALTAVSLSVAKILGVDAKVGSLEQGKEATLFVSSGDALDMRTNDVELAFIQGKKINLDNIQKQLYKKYMEKYGLK